MVRFARETFGDSPLHCVTSARAHNPKRQIASTAYR
jgi:hypothetical protein